jgi:hypothetical protein
LLLQGNSHYVAHKELQESSTHQQSKLNFSKIY